MKPKFYPGTGFQTANGRKVEIYKVTDGYIHGCIDGCKSATTWKTDGKLYGDTWSYGDIIPEPRKVMLQECWLVYDKYGIAVSIHDTEKYAMNQKKKRKGGYIRYIPAEERGVK